MQKIVIAQKFHRYVPTGEVRTVPRIGGSIPAGMGSYQAW